MIGAIDADDSLHLLHARRVAESLTLVEATVREVLRQKAASHGAAWMPVDTFLNSNTPEDTVKLQVLLDDASLGVIVWADDTDFVVEFDADHAHGKGREEKLKWAHHESGVLVGPARDIMKTPKIPYARQYVDDHIEAAMVVKRAELQRSAKLAEKLFNVTEQKRQEAATAAKAAAEKEGQTGKKVKHKGKALERMKSLDAEKKEQLDRLIIALFYQLDAGGVGEVFMEDLTKLASLHGVDVTVKELAAAGKAMDYDGNGEISFGEFSLWFRSGDAIVERLKAQVSVVMLAEMEGRVNCALLGDASTMKLGGHVTDAAVWDTVRGSKSVLGGKWYYEVLLGSGASGRIGFMTTDYELPEGPEGQPSTFGVGDNLVAGESWGYDGLLQNRHHVGLLPYARDVLWKAGDVMGCMLDLDHQTISFTYNGSDLGVAFKSCVLQPGVGIFPACTFEGGPHLLCFSVRECAHAPAGYRLWGNATVNGLAKDARESLLRKKAFLKARRNAELDSKAWVPPVNVAGKALERKRVTVEKRGTGRVTAYNGSKHTVEFDDGSQLTTNLDKAKKLKVLSPTVTNRFVNEIMAERERQLFDQRMKVKAALVEGGNKGSIDEELLEDERAGNILMEILGEFDDDEDEDMSKYEGDETGNEEDEEVVKKKKRRKKQKKLADLGGDDEDNPEAGTSVDAGTSQEMVSSADMGDGVDAATKDLFATLAESEEIKEVFEAEARQACISEKEVWLVLSAEEVELPSALVGQTLRLVALGVWGEVTDYVPAKSEKKNKAGKHVLDVNGKSKKIKINNKAILAGDFKLLDENRYEMLVQQQVAYSHARWVQDQVDRMWGDAKVKAKAEKKLEKQKRRRKQREKVKLHYKNSKEKVVKTSKSAKKHGAKGARAATKATGSVLQTTLNATEAGLKVTSRVLGAMESAVERKEVVEEEVDWELLAREETIAVATLRASQQPEAWLDGKTFKGKDVVGLPCDVSGHGRGVVLRYDAAVGLRSKGFYIDFEIGGKSKEKLSTHREFKVMDLKVVNGLVAADKQQFEEELTAIVDDTTSSAREVLMETDEAWLAGDTSDEKALIGKTIKIGGKEVEAKLSMTNTFDMEASMVKTFDTEAALNVSQDAFDTDEKGSAADQQLGEVVDFKKKRFFIQFPGHKNPTKTKLDEGFVFLNDEYIEGQIAPQIQAAIKPWAQERFDALRAEHVEIAGELELDQERSLDEFVESSAQRELAISYSAAAYLAAVQTRAYERFCITFAPSCQAMDDQLVEDAGGVESILEQTWLTMGLAERLKLQNRARNKLGPGAGATEAAMADFRFEAEEGFQMDMRTIHLLLPVREQLLSPEDSAFYMSGADQTGLLEETKTKDFVSLETFLRWFSSETPLALKIKEAVAELAWPELEILLGWSDPDVHPEQVEKKRSKLKAGVSGTFGLGKALATPVVGGAKLSYALGDRFAIPLARTTVKSAVAITKPAVGLTTAVVGASGKVAAAMANNESVDAAQESMDVQNASAAFAMLDQDEDGLLHPADLLNIGAVAELLLTDAETIRLQAEVFEEEADADLEMFAGWWTSGSDLANRMASESGRFAVDLEAAAQRRSRRQRLEMNSTGEAREQEGAWTAIESVEPGESLGIGREIRFGDEKKGVVEKEGKKGDVV